MNFDTKHTLNTLLNGTDLEAAEMEGLMGAIMDGGLEPAQVAAILVALRAKGESGTEVAAAARAMRDRALGVMAPEGSIDTCGTGGDGAETINISTASALVAAAGGVPVAKHGNRSVSSRCGSADVLEAIGVRLDLDCEALAALLEEVGIAFLFAQKLQPANGLQPFGSPHQPGRCSPSGAWCVGERGSAPGGRGPRRARCGARLSRSFR